MKIEKVNEHQIRCTLTREDLASRKLKLSELAYGSEKAKELFRDMMEKANDEYGFEADNIPLMIEAIPVNSECIVLIITKVEDPDELDTRFSKFAPGIADKDDSDSDFDDDDDLPEPTNADAGITDIAGLFKRFKEAADSKGKDEEKGKDKNANVAFEGMAFEFASITELATICRSAVSFFSGISSLYMDASSGRYLLTISRKKMDVQDFVRICNLLSEYGAPQRGRQISEAYLREHFEPVCIGNAVETVAELG